MKKILALVCLGLVCNLSAPAFAGSQQEKMKGCNAEAKGMKGDERKAFMKKCLKKDYVLKSSPAKEEAAAKPSQKDRMKSCNADAKAKGLKGDERKKFMSSCLKG